MIYKEYIGIIHMYTQYEICLAAVKKDGLLLQYVPVHEIYLVP